MAKEIFDYSKVDHNDYAYYGFHLKNGRYHIDTKRLKKLHYESAFPIGLFSASRNTRYFIPKHKKENEWAIGALRTKLNELARDWNLEYKEVIKRIETPKDVFQHERLEGISYTSSKDDYDEIDFNALLSGIKREKKYYQVIKSIYFQYIQKIFIEYFRTLLIVIKDRGYEDKEDFTYQKLCFYVQDAFHVTSIKANPLFKLPHYKYFDLLNKVDNFLKHNTRSAYMQLENNPYEKDEELKTFLSSYVISEKDAGCKYESGMYAGNWLKIESDFIENIIIYLHAFSAEFCNLLYEENEDESFWNSDEALLKILKDKFFCFE